MFQQQQQRTLRSDGEGATFALRNPAAHGSTPQACQRRAGSSVADAQDSAILESFAFNSLAEREAIRIAAIFLCNCLSTGETW